MSVAGQDLVFHPLVPAHLAAAEALFDSGSEPRRCSCMYWRLAPGAWRDGTAAERRAMFRARVAAGPPPGVVALRGGEAVGWVQATPRAEVPRFNAARAARPAAGSDPGRTWVLSCFFVRSDCRRLGLMTGLAEAACAFAAAEGAAAVEAAPLAPRRPLTWAEGYVGIASALARAGFVTVEQRTELRALMRWTPRAAAPSGRGPSLPTP